MVIFLLKVYHISISLESNSVNKTKKEFDHSQYAHDVVLTSVRRRFNVMDVVWMSCAYWVIINPREG